MTSTMDIADSVTETINTLTLHTDFWQAKCQVAPRFDLTAVSDKISIIVVPLSMEIEHYSRVADKVQHTINVGVYRRASRNDDLDDFVRTMATRTSELYYLIIGKTIDIAGIVLTASSIDPIYSSDHLQQYRAFLSVISLTYVAIEAKS